MTMRNLTVVRQVTKSANVLSVGFIQANDAAIKEIATLKEQVIGLTRTIEAMKLAESNRLDSEFRSTQHKLEASNAMRLAMIASL